MTSPHEEPFQERPVDTQELPAAEDISAAEAEERLDLDPEEQANYTDQSSGDDAAH